MNMVLSEILVKLDLWWVQCLVIISVATVIYWVANGLLRKAAKKAAVSANMFDDALVEALSGPTSYGVLLGALAGIMEVVYSEFEYPILDNTNEAIYVAIAIFIGWFFLRLIRIRENQILRGDVSSGTDETTVTAISKILRLCVIVLTSLVCFQTLGFSVSGIIAFGGIGGAAVAFASKDLLANFFGGFMVFMDKPFAVGEWIRSPDRNIEGTVEYIGWRITRIRTFDKRPLYVPNSVFTQISIENPSRMSHRRINETIGVRYTDFTQVKKICDDIKQMLTEHDGIDETQTMMVNFNKFGESSLEFFIYTFTKTTDWQTYHVVKEDVLLQVGHIILTNKAEVAFPSRTLYMQQPINIPQNGGKV